MEMSEKEIMRAKRYIKIAQPKNSMLSHDLKRIAGLPEEKAIRYIKGLDAIFEKAKHPEIPCRACGTLDDLDGNAHKGERGELCFTCCERFAESDDWTGNYWDYV